MQLPYVNVWPFRLGKESIFFSQELSIVQDKWKGNAMESWTNLIRHSSVTNAHGTLVKNYTALYSFKKEEDCDL